MLAYSTLITKTVKYKVFLNLWPQTLSRTERPYKQSRVYYRYTKRWLNKTPIILRGWVWKTDVPINLSIYGRNNCSMWRYLSEDCYEHINWICILVRFYTNDGKSKDANKSFILDRNLTFQNAVPIWGTYIHNASCK